MPEAMNLAHIRSVLLDMDGTLVDSDAAVDRAWQSWLAEYGFDPTVPVEGLHGSPRPQSGGCRPDLDDDAVGVAVRRQMAPQYDDLHDTVATPGAPELLASLDDRGIPWAVVTSADARLATVRLHSAGLTVPNLITSDDVSAGKPDPQGYLLAARRVGEAPDRCLVVEDAEPGVRAGQAAGCTVAGLKGVPADLSIAHLGELDALLPRG